MIVAEVSIAPFGKGTSLSRYVKEAVRALRGSGLKVTPCPMGTVLEAGDLGSILQAVEQAHDAVRAVGGQRISINLKVDARYDKDASSEEKMRSIDEL